MGCMANKNCLKDLATQGSAPDFELRNDPAKQLECLQNDGVWPSAADAISSSCEKFYNCVNGTGNKDHLETTLLAMAVPSGLSSLLQLALSTSSVSGLESVCVH